MKIGEMLGLKDNPFYDLYSSNRNSISGALSGAAANPGNPWGGATIGAQQGARQDEFISQQQAEEAKRAEQINQTAAFLRAKGAEDLAAGVESGMTTGSDAFNRWYQQANAPAAAAPKPMEINGQLVDPVTGQVLGDYRDPQGVDMPSAPSGYQWGEGGNLAYIPGGPADPATAANKPPTEAERKALALTTVTQKDAALLFGDENSPGIFDALGGSVDQGLQVGGFGINPLAGFASSDYKLAKDAISNITQSYLYAMSGATAPPEEVKKITEQVTPQPLDSPEQKKWKRERLLSMYSAIEGAQGNATPALTNDGWQDMGNGVRIRPVGQ